MTFFPKKHVAAAIIGGLLVSSIAASSNRAENLPYAKAVSAMKNSHFDSAFHYLQTAAAAGLPDDSLYYLWAQLYLEQGTLDTALALNLAAIRTGSQTLGTPLMEQKYLIYATLGWKDEANALLDSLSQQKAPGSRLIPRLSLDTWLGMNNRRLIDGQPYPFIATGTARNIQNPGVELTAKSEWFIPAGKTMVFVPALYYNFANGLEQTERRLDSLNHSIGVSLGLRNFLPHFSFDYSLLRSRRSG